PIEGGSCLPEVEPTSAEDLGAALLIALPPGDLRRAIAVIARLAKPPVLVIAPPHDADGALLDACAQAADVIVMPLPAALAASGTDDALTAGLAIRARGAKAVVLTAGMLGGIIVYGDKTVTYPAMPMARSASPGTGAAFAGALAAWCAGEGADFRGIKRGCAMASAVGGICDQGVGPKKLLSVGRKEYVERFNRLRRTNKF
ncbi:MAG: hypothetical protein H0W83_17595, partial [Planctomycetes bacterium]|nr:hypothetical protein [Planctomycetota bacterium]